MHLTCPACDAGYEVPDDKVGEGRRVRCANCGHVWAAAAPDPVSKPAPAPDPEPAEPAPELAAMPTPPAARPLSGSAMEQLRAQPVELPRQSRKALIGWVLTAVILAAAGWAAVAYREPIMRAWPPSTRAYAALGLAGGPAH